MTKPRILLADDHVLLLGAFQRLLEPEYEIVGSVTNGQALLVAAAELKPDIAIVDIAMPQLSGLAAASQVKQSCPRTKVMFVTMNPDTEIAVEAFRSGASAYLLKTSAAAELLHAIRQVLRGGTYVTPSITKDMVGSIMRQPQRRKPLSSLTPRQREVVQLLAEGRSMKEVGRMLNLTPRTVAFHKYRTMEHLRIRSFAELVQFAVQQGIITRPNQLGGD